jgi:hypothetical protein
MAHNYNLVVPRGQDINRCVDPIGNLGYLIFISGGHVYVTYEVESTHRRRGKEGPD